MSEAVRRVYTSIPFTAVSIQDNFWSPRLFVNRERTLATEYSQLKETGRIDAFRLNWRPGQEPVPHFFWDSDVAKWIEAAAYVLAAHPDPELDALVDTVIALIASAQQPDGYLNMYFSIVEPGERWQDLRDAHELYCAGHLIEAAVAHFQATGKRSLLEPMCRYADHIAAVFGTGDGQQRGYPGHQEIELALVKLYHVTGEERYLKLSRYFVDERGQQSAEHPHYFDLETERLKQAGKRHHFDSHFRQSMPHKFDYRYNQSHLPVREQSEVVGHAVRALYLYAAMADLAGETGDASLLAACQRLWENLCTTRMYLTGGVGNSRGNEGFTFDYDLPNETAYAETCAAVALVFWNQRLLQLNCDSRYADVLERALYNGVISGISLDGKSFFYENPLASLGGHHRQPWFDCACCPPNVARLLASLGGYIYAASGEDLAVHLYIGGQTQFDWRGQQIGLQQETDYPWEGTVNLRLTLERPDTFGLKLRLPGWCKSAQLTVNGQDLQIQDRLERGYIRIEREWQTGDEVRLTLEMPIERVYAHPNVRQNAGRVALQRGPLVYCIEQADHTAPIEHIRLPREAQVNAQLDPNLFDGVVTLRSEACAVDPADWQGNLYQNQPPDCQPIQITAIPYFTWDNRAPGSMQVWIPES